MKRSILFDVLVLLRRQRVDAVDAFRCRRSSIVAKLVGAAHKQQRVLCVQAGAGAHHVAWTDGSIMEGTATGRDSRSPVRCLEVTNNQR